MSRFLRWALLYAFVFGEPFFANVHAQSASTRNGLKTYQERLTLDKVDLQWSGQLPLGHRRSTRTQRQKQGFSHRQFGDRSIHLDKSSVTRRGEDSGAGSPKPFDYANEKIRGVSIGGWLVSEPFIKPSLYFEANRKDPRIQDEWTFCEYQNRDVVEEALRAHWDTWIGEADFYQIAKVGLNHVRIPVGYWAVDIAPGEPYISGSLVFLDLAIQWASRYGLKVLIDLHGAPGSQNGLDNSGRRGAIDWPRYRSNVERTLKILKILVDEYSKPRYRDVVTAIEPINEPWGVNVSNLPVIEQYYSDGFALLKSASAINRNPLMFVIHDAFRGVRHWQDFMVNSTYHHKVIIDTHIYSIFDDTEIRYTEAERIKRYCAYGEELSELTAGGFAPVVGEWTNAGTDCNQLFPGVDYPKHSVQQIGWGSRYEGTYPGSERVGSCRGKSTSGSSFDQAYRDQLGRFWQAQVDTYERGQGWIMWTWRTEVAADFSYQSGLEYGWIPTSVTERHWKDLCTTSPPQRLESAEANQTHGVTSALSVEAKVKIPPGVDSNSSANADDTFSSSASSRRPHLQPGNGLLSSIYGAVSSLMLFFVDAFALVVVWTGL